MSVTNTDTGMPARLKRTLEVMLAGCVLSCAGFYYATASGASNSIPTYLIVFILMGLLCFSDVRSDIRDLFRQSHLLPVACLFILYMIISITWSDTSWLDNPVVRQLKFLGWAVLIFAFLLAVPLAHHRFERLATWMFWIILCTGTASSLLALYLHFDQPLVESRLRAPGRLHNPVGGATAYGLVLLVAVYLAGLRRTPVALFLLALCMASLLTVIILTGTRLIWPALWVALCVNFYFLFPRHRLRQLALAGLSLILLALLLVVSRDVDEWLQRGWSFRPVIWQEFLGRIFNGYLLTGAGLAADPHVILDGIPHAHPHSNYISAFFHGGVIGLALFLGIILVTAKEIYRHRAHPLACPIAVIMTYGLVQGLFDSNKLIVKINFFWLVFWLPVALTLCLTRKARSDE